MRGPSAEAPCGAHRDPGFLAPFFPGLDSQSRQGSATAMLLALSQLEFADLEDYRGESSRTGRMHLPKGFRVL